jgi:hypothetical protein
MVSLHHDKIFRQVLLFFFENVSVSVVRTGSTCPTWRNLTEHPGKIMMAKAAAPERVHSPTREEIAVALGGLKRKGKD